MKATRFDSPPKEDGNQRLDPTEGHDSQSSITISFEDGSEIDRVLHDLLDLSSIAKTGRDLRGNRQEVNGAMFPVVVKDLELKLGRLVFAAITAQIT
jgi:hypothetical protein